MKETTMNHSTLYREDAAPVFANYQGNLVEVRLQTSWGVSIIRTAQGLLYTSTSSLQIIQEY